MLDSVFDLFVQSHRTLDRAQGGLGVGLTLVRSLVGMHGERSWPSSEGRARAASSSSACPSRPQARDQEVAPRTPRTVRRRAGRRSSSSRTTTTAARCCCEYLSAAGFECQVARRRVWTGSPSSRSCGRTVAHHRRRTPGHRRLRGRAPVRSDAASATLPGRADRLRPAGDRVAAREAGFDEHLVKPVLPDRLLALLSGTPRCRATPGPRQIEGGFSSVGRWRDAGRRRRVEQVLLTSLRKPCKRGPAYSEG